MALLDRDRQWIRACWEAHSERLIYGKTALGDWSFDEAWEMCWCCGGSGRRLQKCHIVPRSLGGTCKAENIIPLCPMCHDEMPDVMDASAVWVWLEKKQNPLSGIGLGRFHGFVAYALSSCNQAIAAGKDIDPYVLAETWRQYIRHQTSVHGGQHGQGMYLKQATLEWAIDKALELSSVDGQIELLEHWAS